MIQTPTDEQLIAEFKAHYERITNAPIPDDEMNFFINTWLPIMLAQNKAVIELTQDCFPIRSNHQVLEDVISCINSLDRLP